tara:strand:+ start:1443 stop:1763 length:321 start_codon:yes stop_codon:yes gene_type:complete
MKLLILLCLLFLMTCQSAYGTEPATPKFSSFYIFNWIANCAQALHPMLMQQGYPESIAIREAAGHCSCVVDGFRRNFTQEETQKLSYSDRQLFSENYAQQCFGMKL